MMTQPPNVHLMDEITDEAAGILEMVPNYSQLEGVEVGVLRGKTSSILLLRRPGLFLHMVDPFWTEGIVKDSPNDVARAAMRNTDFAADRRRLYRMPSLEAAPTFDADQLDFVYIDADHRYEHVLADCRAWWPKVRSGGVLCGHDYGRERPRGTLEGQGDWGVERAVKKFLAEVGLELFHEDRKRTNWGVLKP